jgi:hypothetical protein
MTWARETVRILAGSEMPAKAENSSTSAL